MVEVQRCRAVKSDGSPCKLGHSLNAENGMCMWHDPARKAAREGMQARGRANRGPKRPKRIETVEGVVAARDWLFGELMNKRIEKDEAASLRQLLSDQEKSITTDLLGRVKALQEQLKAAAK